MATAREQLENLLGALGESSRFVTSGSLTPVLPGLEVKGIGPIAFPVSAAEARRLIEKATQAPYGRGEQTIVDTSVRRVWQIEPSRFSLRNREWNAHIEAIVDRVRLEFAIHQKVKAQLYKLLIYEKGSFFAPHRDSEKLPGMFATLVVCLPSRHEGGTLIVRHDSQTETIEFGGKDSEFQTQFAAFYADCQHEIAPVKSGYRVCLVYNLAIAGKKQPSAPRISSAVEKAAELLEELFADPAYELDKIVIPLEHQYTQAGLDPRQLKGSDRALADVLFRAANSLDYPCYLALLTHHQSGEPDYDTLAYENYGGHRSYGTYSYDEDEEEDLDDTVESDVEMAEVFDEERTLEHWLDPQGRSQPFGALHVDECEVIFEADQGVSLFRQEIQEATGNEGVSMDRWYRTGVVVIWPRDRYFRILASEGPNSALPALEKMVAHGKKPAALEDCRRFAEEVIHHWQTQRHYSTEEVSNTSRMLKVLERVGTVEIVHHFLRNVVPNDFNGTEGKSLQRVCQRLGWKHFATDLRHFLSQQEPTNYYTRIEHIVAICEPVCCDPPALTKDRLAVCSKMADELARLIDRWDSESTQSWYQRQGKRTGVVASVVRIFATLSAAENLDRFLSHVLSDPKHYDLHEVLIPDLKAIHRWLPDVPGAKGAASRLLNHCLRELRAATARPIEPPTDWARDADLDCKCEDCRALGEFLRDPNRREARFPIRKERRRHLHQQIERHRCDITHATERRGSPQTLVCTKTQESYERRLKQYEVDTKLLAELEAMAGKKKGTAARRSPGRRTRSK